MTKLVRLARVDARLAMSVVVNDDFLSMVVVHNASY